MFPAPETEIPALILAAVVAYLLGSVPFGLVMARLFGLGDPRLIGSGNIGATNILRTGSKTAAFFTLALDAGKAGIAVFAARAVLAEDAAQIAAIAAFAGHCFPITLKFKGGKGVATFLGALAALGWPLGLAACATWLITALVFRVSSLAALAAAALSPFWARLLGSPSAAALCVALAVLIFIRHRSNIARLLKGDEPRIGGAGR